MATRKRENEVLVTPTEGSPDSQAGQETSEQPMSRSKRRYMRKLQRAVEIAIESKVAPISLYPPADRLRYFQRLDSPGGALIYGHAECTISQGSAKKTIVDSFTYCHFQNNQPLINANQNGIEIEDIIKAFDLANSHAHLYANATSEARHSGSGFKTCIEGLIGCPDEKTYKVDANNCLVNYIEITVLPFVIEDSGDDPKVQKQMTHYLHVPTSGVISRTVSSQDLEHIAASGKVLLNASTWDIFSDWKVQTSDVLTHSQTLSPKTIPQKKTPATVLDQNESPKYFDSFSQEVGNYDLSHFCKRGDFSIFDPLN